MLSTLLVVVGGAKTTVWGAQSDWPYSDEQNDNYGDDAGDSGDDPGIPNTSAGRNGLCPDERHHEQIQYFMLKMMRMV